MFLAIVIHYQSFSATKISGLQQISRRLNSDLQHPTHVTRVLEIASAKCPGTSASVLRAPGTSPVIPVCPSDIPRRIEHAEQPRTGKNMDRTGFVTIVTDPVSHGISIDPANHVDLCH